MQARRLVVASWGRMAPDFSIKVPDHMKRSISRRRNCLLLCRFLDAGNERRSARSASRRPKTYTEGNIDGQIGGICFTLRNGPAQDARHVLSASVLAFPSFLGRHTATFMWLRLIGGAVLLSRALAPTPSSNACSGLRENASSSFPSPRRVRIQVSANQTPATI